MGGMPKGPEWVFGEEEYKYEVDVSLAACCLRMRLLGRKAIGCWKATGGCSSPRGLHTALFKCGLGGGAAKPNLKRAPHFAPNPWGQELPSV